MKFLLSLISALFFVLSFVAAADHQTLYDIVDAQNDESASTKPKADAEESQNAAATRRKRVRRTVAVVDKSSSSSNEVIDPFDNYMVLAENEDVLLRELNKKVYSVPPPKPPPKSKPGVSSQSTTGRRC